MAKAGYLYRRSSGIYVIRICVPLRLKHLVGKGEMHISTSSRDLATAKVAAFNILAHWQSRVLAGGSDMELLAIKDGSALLVGTGHVLLQDVLTEFGLSEVQLYTEIRNVGANLFCFAGGWQGRLVSTCEIERELDDGSFSYADAWEKGVDYSANSILVLTNTGRVLDELRAKGEYNDCSFYLEADRKKAFFVDWQGKSFQIDSIYLDKKDVERIRVRLAAGISAEALQRARDEYKYALTLTAPTAATGHKHGMKRVSDLVAEFVKAKLKTGSWKPDEQRRIEGSFSLFIRLLQNPQLKDLDRELLRKYDTKLATLPANMDRVIRKSGTDNLVELGRIAIADGLPLLSRKTIDFHLQKFGELCKWGFEEGYLAENPGVRIVTTKRTKREQDDRLPFSDAELQSIFGYQWFRDGKGKPTSDGDYYEFLPFYYWLPLLAIYTGGRLNELCQLYLDDIKQTATGTHYLDFNLDGVDKLDADKSLKNVNAKREVPLANALIDLGFIAYVNRLRKRGEKRLFPELRLDPVKGYGKAAGAWFNHRFLKGKIGIARDGTKTAHSLRHNRLSSLFNADMNENKVAQLAGHARGTTMSGIRYRTDANVDLLKELVNIPPGALPTICPFDIEAGVVALDSALKRKERGKAYKARRISART